MIRQDKTNENTLKKKKYFLTTNKYTHIFV